MHYGGPGNECSFNIAGFILIPVLGFGWELGGSRLFGQGGFDLVH
jgi:hypothetical protein